MNEFKAWPLGRAMTTGLALAGLLVGCGSGSSDPGSVSLRVANATLTHASIDLLVNGSAAASSIASDAISGYVTPAAGSVTLQVNDAGSSASLATTVPTLASGNHFTLLTYESGGVVKTAVLSEDYAAPNAGSAQIRVFDTALDAGKLDVYITDPSVDLAAVSSPTATFTAPTSVASSALLTYSPGSYRVRVTAAGNKSDVRADIPAFTIASQQIATVALTPASGGALINGSTLIQQAGYTPARNTNTRVRLAAAVSGGAMVAASATSPNCPAANANTCVIDGGSIAPAFGYYTLVPATASLNITVNGNSVGAPAAVLQAGSDVTLFVYGAPGGATARLIADDNRLPGDTTTTKLRLIDGITGSTGALTLTANTAPVGTGIAAGAASDYVTVLGSTSAMNLTLSSSAVAGVLYQNTSYVLGPNESYTVLAGGDISGPQLLIR